MIAIVDYDAGNLMSVKKALEYIGEKPVVTRDADTILKADKVILPGVGAFGDCMDKLNSYELTDVLRETAQSGKPFLGICLGLQLMFDRSDESKGVPGLSILEGDICAIPNDGVHKIPHMGWNSLHFPKESRLFAGIPEGAYVYFVHSYYLAAKDSGIVAAETDYVTHIHAAVEKDNIFACQFHPEKSGDVGLAILKNFVTL
ncbi:MAG: imidazole glycerol phosphate synthase subunit HisH [Lachnospiraceae bacterium]|nr:imidazole glycerol phosphate synthase subunit HisH [Lachnospiraceae bacterium]